MYDGGFLPEEAEKEKISVSVDVISLRNINTLEQTFEAILSIHLEWRSSTSSLWQPMLLFTNAVGEVNVLHSERECRGSYGTNATTTIVTGLFAELFEVQQFPLDYQQLSIKIKLVNCPAYTRKRKSIHVQVAAQSMDDEDRIANVLLPSFSVLNGDILPSLSVSPHLTPPSSSLSPQVTPLSSSLTPQVETPSSPVRRSLSLSSHAAPPPPVAPWPHQPQVTKWPHQPQVTPWPHQPQVTKWPHQPQVTPWPHQPQVVSPQAPSSTINVSSKNAINVKAIAPANAFDVEFYEATMAEDAFIDDACWERIGDVRLHAAPVQGSNGGLESIPTVAMVVGIMARRRPSHFLWFFIFPVSMQVTYGCITFILPPQDLANKMEITLNLVLTMFAVKFSTVHYLPSVACLTLLEVYFILSIISLSLIMGQNVVVYLLSLDRIEDNITWKDSSFNVASGAIIGICWLLIQVVVYAIMTLRSVRNLLIKPRMDGARVNPRDGMIVATNSA